MTAIKKVTRREFLKLSGMAAGATILAACTPQVAQPTATTQPTTAPAQPTAIAQPATALPATSVPQPTATTQAVPTATAVPTISTAILNLQNEGRPNVVRNFNPFSPNHLYETLVSIYEPLLLYNKVTSVYLPWLAASYQYNSDATKLIFTMQQGVKWSDGQDFSANDVVFTFQLLQKFPALDTGAVWANLASVSAPDANTVEFDFKQGYVPGLLNLASAAIVPQHIWAAIADPVNSTNDNPVGTGPFTQVTELTVSYYQVERNPYYWQTGKPYFQGIKSLVYGSGDDQLMADASGSLDWDSSFYADINNSYKAKDPTNNHWAAIKDGNATFVYMNTTKKPFDDVNVRKAISMALDRDTMLHTALYDYSGAPDATGLTYTFNSWKDPDIMKNNANLVTLDVATANQMLDAAGLKKGSDGFRTLPDGTPMHLYVDNAGWADYAAISQIIAQNLKAVSINAEARSKDPNTWMDEFFKGNYDLACAWSNTGSTPYDTYRGLMSAQTNIPVGTSAGANYERYTSTKADALLAQMAATPDDATAKALCKQIEQVFVDEFPVAPIYNQANLVEWSTRRFTGWPDETSPNFPPEAFEIWPPPYDLLILLTTLRAKE